VHRNLLALLSMPDAVPMADIYHVQGNSRDKLHVELFARSGCTRAHRAGAGSCLTHTRGQWTGSLRL